MAKARDDRIGVAGETWKPVDDVALRSGVGLVEWEAQARLAFAFESSGIAMAFVSPDARLLQVNQAYCDMMGRSEAELLTLSIADVSHPDDREASAAAIKGALAGEGDSVRIEKRYVRRDGTVIWGVVNAKVVRDDAGAVVGLFAQIVDVTEAKAREAALQGRNDRLEFLAEGADDIALFRMRFRPELVIEYASSGSLAMTGHSPQELYAHPERLFEAFHPDDIPMVQQDMASGQPSGSKMFRFIHPDGKVVTSVSRTFPIFDDSGEVVGLEGIAYDVTARVQAEAELERRANEDQLTGLPNQLSFRDRLTALLAHTTEDRPLAVLSIDVDGIASIAEAFGYGRADGLIVEVARRLQHGLEDDAVLARTGTDEFAMALSYRSRDEATERAHSLLVAFEKPFLVGDDTFQIDASVGIAVAPEHGLEAELLLRRAERACRTAREREDGVRRYTSDLDESTAERLSLLGQLREAMEESQLALHYQPQLDLASGNVYGAEALLRWSHPELGFVPPDRFIPLAERTGLIGPLTRWAVETAVRQIDRWQQQGIHLTVAVNITARNLQDPNFADDVAAILASVGVEGSSLWLEVTERAITRDPETARQTCRRLTDMGIKLSLDDFGTGQSSLAHLATLPISELKVDMSFIRPLASDPQAAGIVRMIIDLAHHLGQQAIAEGVEDEITLELLAALNCDAVQGYYLAKPLPASELTAWLMARQTNAEG